MAFLLGSVGSVAVVLLAGEGVEAAFSSSEVTRVEELREEDLDVKLSDCMRLAKLGGAEAEWWW